MSTGMGGPRSGTWGELEAVRAVAGKVCPGLRARGETLPFSVHSQIFMSLPPEITRRGKSWGPGRREREGRPRKASLPGKGIPSAAALFS